MNLSPSTIRTLNEARSKRQAGYGKRIVLKPNPDYARRCAAQLPPERRERLLRAVGLWDG